MPHNLDAQEENSMGGAIEDPLPAVITEEFDARANTSASAAIAGYGPQALGAEQRRTRMGADSMMAGDETAVRNGGDQIHLLAQDNATPGTKDIIASGTTNVGEANHEQVSTALLSPNAARLRHDHSAMLPQDITGAAGKSNTEKRVVMPASHAIRLLSGMDAHQVWQHGVFHVDFRHHCETWRVIEGDSLRKFNIADYANVNLAKGIELHAAWPYGVHRYGFCHGKRPDATPEQSLAAFVEVVRKVIECEKQAHIASQPHRTQSLAWLQWPDDGTTRWDDLPVVVWIKRKQKKADSSREHAQSRNNASHENGVGGRGSGMRGASPVRCAANSRTTSHIGVTAALVSPDAARLCAQHDLLLQQDMIDAIGTHNKEKRVVMSVEDAMRLLWTADAHEVYHHGVYPVGAIQQSSHWIILDGNRVRDATLSDMGPVVLLRGFEFHVAFPERVCRYRLCQGPRLDETPERNFAAIFKIVEATMQMEKMAQLRSKSHYSQSTPWMRHREHMTTDWRSLPVIVWLKGMQQLPSQKRTRV